MLGSPRCEVCGKDLGPRAADPDAKVRQVTCSAKCRSLRWRKRRTAALEAGLTRLRDGLLLLRDQVDDRLGEVDRVLAELRSGPRDG